MKNIHILPTSQPSRFYFNNNDKCFQLCKVDKKSTPLKINQHIYITSDEEIKEGEWCFDGSYLIQATPKLVDAQGLFDRRDWRKIILTTDQDLIKDGVQAINDEFLEWFVKNPSCESVGVEEKYRKCCRNTDGKNENCIEPINCEGWLSKEYERPYKTTCDKRFEGYKIIIPKEEKPLYDYGWCKGNVVLPQEPERRVDICYNFDKEIGCIQNDCRCEKAETLEEAAERIAYDSTEENRGYPSIKIFIKGAKWQAKRMYSEEEIHKIVESYQNTMENNPIHITYDQWFEQFKKK
jgi:hypothetical protein